MILQENMTLVTGNPIPKLALGTWQTPDAAAEGAVAAALSMGYRHIDTAVGYGNESGVGRGIKASGAARENIFLTSKIPAEVKTYDGAKKTIEESLARLDTPYLDLMLIHAPRPWSEMRPDAQNRYYDENLAVWEAMQEAYADGRLRAIGVSNFQIPDIENLLKRAKVAPHVNQISVQAGNVNEELIRFCKVRGILVEAYSPIATGRLLSSPQIGAMAEKYGVSAAQICIRFVLQLGLVALPKTVHEAYMKQNTEVDFVLSEDDMQTLLSL